MHVCGTYFKKHFTNLSKYVIFLFLFTSGISTLKWRSVYVYDLSSWLACISEINCDLYETRTKTEGNTCDNWDRRFLCVRYGLGFKKHLSIEHRVRQDLRMIRKRTRQNVTFTNLFYFLILHLTNCRALPPPTPRSKLLTLCFIIRRVGYRQWHGLHNQLLERLGDTQL